MGDLLKTIASPAIMNHAWNQVRHDRTHWTTGVGMAEVERHLILHIGRLAEELLAGRYRPEAGRCFKVAKANGGFRVICAPGLRDKLAQRATLTVLEPLGERLFHTGSYGYRPLCTLDMALARLREWVRLGYVWLGDADIVQCFDSIPHVHALGALADLCQEEPVTRLVKGWIEKAPDWTRPRGPGFGLPQGMVLSPFLCNLYLHQMDMVFDEAGIPFVRYADDFIVMGRTQAEALAALELGAECLRLLDLRLNRDKTQVFQTDAQHRFLGKRLPNVRPGIRI